VVDVAKAVQRRGIGVVELAKAARAAQPCMVEQAWEALRQDPYDLLVTDNEMPRLTGINLIERIRKAGMSLPVIVVSSAFPVDRVGDYPQLQITAAIPKPFSRLKFLDTVKSALSSNEDSFAVSHR